uniref:Tegument protein/v-FGAM-synthase n=1 Tax=Porcine lymphotropic herpesvirus 3 TaxID=199308 RepID=Q8B415_9GAMA|nr:tegument protein/v-FGAM-synthase [Porcine lymphotropic herpesvirus 3]
MGSHGIFLYSSPAARLTPQESILIDSLQHGEYKLPDGFRVEIEDAFVVIINNLLLDSPVTHRYKIKLLRAARNLIKGADNAIYPPFRRPETENTLIFMYGPNINDAPTTLSDDLRNLVSASVFSNPTKYFNVERIEKVRILILSGDISLLAPFHGELVESILCNKVTEVRPLDLEKYDFTGRFQVEGANVRTGPDEIQKWFEGEDWRSSGIKQDIIHTSSLFQQIGFNDTTRGFLGFKSEEADHWFIMAIAEDGGIVPDRTGIMGSELYSYESSEGLAFVSANIEQGANQLTVVRNIVNKLPTALPIASHFGVLYRTPSHFQSLDGAYSDQVEDMLIDKFIRCYTSAFTCSGVPTCLGFTRFSSVFKEDGPISYTGSVCIGPADKFEFLPITPEILNGVKDLGDSLKVFQIGVFDYKLMSHEDGILKHADSGRDAVSLINLLYNLSREFDTTQIHGIFGNKNWNCVNVDKLSLACGEDCGLEIHHSALPLETQRRLKRWSPRNMQHNYEVIESTWLNIVSRVVYITIRDGGDKVTSRRLKMMCRAFGCPVLYLGEITDTITDIVVTGEFHGSPENLTFKKTNVKTSSPENPIPVRWEAPAFTGTSPSMSISSQDDAKSLLLSILQHPTVGSKKYIVYHTDRCGNGHIAQQQGVGPFDCPVSDYSVQILNLVPPVEQNMYWSELHDNLYDMFEEYQENIAGQVRGNVFQYSWQYGLTLEVPDKNKMYMEPKLWGICSALGEQNVISQFDVKEGIAWAITEALFNLCLSPLEMLEHVIITMAFGWPLVRNVKTEMKEAMLYARNFCEKLGVSFEVDLCKQINNSGDGTAGPRHITACASCPCALPSYKITPYLRLKRGSQLLHVSLVKSLTSQGSIYTELTGKAFGVSSLNINPQLLRQVILFLIEIKKEGLIVSGHDVSDGGLFSCIAEMVIASATKAQIIIPPKVETIEFLCSQTPGVVIQVFSEHVRSIISKAKRMRVSCTVIGNVHDGLPPGLEIVQGSATLANFSLKQLRDNWELYASKQDLLWRNEGEESLDDSVYGDYEVVLPKECFYINVLPDERHKVTVYLLPGCNRPDALLAALTGSGCNPRVISTSGQTTLGTVHDRLSDGTTVGVIIYGTPNITDTESGMNAMSQYVLRNKHIIRDIQNVLKMRGRFSVAIGPMACQLLFESKMISYTHLEGSVPTVVKNVSGRYESRWLNFHIPQNTKAIAFQDLKGCILPCWAQGTHLGFGHKNPEVFAQMEERGQVASMFYGQRASDGPASKYPLNPSEGYPYAGLCSEDGRHLALLYDPCLAFHTSQWQHVNKVDADRLVSPWKMMFYRLQLWSISVRNGADIQSRNDVDPQQQFATSAGSFPFESVRGAIPAAGEQVPNMFIP